MFSEISNLLKERVSMLKNTSLCSSYSSELLQNSDLSINLVRQILRSGRLLIDHVEVLEQCLAEQTLSPPKTDVFAITKATGLVAGVILCNHIMTSRLKMLRTALMTTTTGYGLLCAVKIYGKVHNKVIERRLGRLIKCIESFGNCINRNIVYFNEIQYIKTKPNATNLGKDYNEIVYNCIQSIKDVTLLLFHAIRKLEDLYPLKPAFADLYVPMENLEDCDYYRRSVIDYGSSNLKDFYNIFTYVQSQFFMRLGLSSAQDSSILFLRTEILTLIANIQEHVTEEEISFKRLSADMKNRVKPDLSRIRKGFERQDNFGPSAILKDNSLKINSCITAIASEFHQLDDTLHFIADEFDEAVTQSLSDKSDKFLDVIDTMKNIENSLSTCSDDFRRLILTYNKFLETNLNLNTGLTISQRDESMLENISPNDENSTNLVPYEPAELEKKDEFYAYIYDELKEKSAENTKDSEEYSVKDLVGKVSRRKFKPVLVQLKKKIDPIREQMLLKERIALELQGIDVDKLYDAAEGETKEAVVVSSDESEDEYQYGKTSSKKKLLHRDNYKDVRQALIHKAPLNLFTSQMPVNLVGSEEVLE